MPPTTNGNNASQPAISNRDLLAIRNYVTAKDGTNPYGEAIHPDTVIVDLTHSNLQQRHIEIRISKHMPLSQLYELIHRKTGSCMDDQILQVFDRVGALQCDALPAYQDRHHGQRPVAFFGMEQHGMRIHCIDTNPHAISARGALENTALVPKYVMSDDEYNARTTGTLRAWVRAQQALDPSFTIEKHGQRHQAYVEAVRRHRMGLPLPNGFQLAADGTIVAATSDPTRSGNSTGTLPGQGCHGSSRNTSTPSGTAIISDNTTSIPNTNHHSEDDTGERSVAHCHVGGRCQVQPGGRRGRVAWVGTITEGQSVSSSSVKAMSSALSSSSSSSYWVGVILDEPMGHNDGTFGINGKRYFVAPPKHGVFCRGKNVEVGDFPEQNLFLDSDDDDDEL